jgi:1,2-diacylglycerol 3-beta-galactosyltransferase
MVVSLVPNLDRAIAVSVKRALPGVPFVTILTDLADYPPHFWIERESEFLVCGSDRAVEQARAMGHPNERIFRASGMILHPRFYEPAGIDRATERRRLGLDPGLPTALVLFGGQGSNVMLDIARRVDRSELKLQTIFICGHNENLRERLGRLPARLPRFVEGFTTEAPYYMRLADFLIGKPGPGSISEALAMGLPVIVERNAWTLPQERYNADWVLERQVGLVVRHFRYEIIGAVKKLLEPANFARFRARAAAISNRAVFEIPEILDKVLKCAAVR